MSRIRGADTAPELLLRRMLWQEGLRYRLHWRTPAGRADLAFPGRKIAIFVDGCFWHGCPQHYVPPRSSRPFWARKLRGNVERDQRQTVLLEDQGWSVLRFWEHEVEADPALVAKEIRAALAVPGSRQPDKPRVIAVEFLTKDGRKERQHLVALHGTGQVGTVDRPRTTTKWRGH
jgi:DNA mismatch endonuclease (patch repair protein)